MQGFNTDCFIFNQSNCKVNLSNLADKRQIDHRVIKTYRGMIYDRNGEILAMSLPKKTLCINIFQTRKMLKNENINYSKLLKLIGMPKKKFQNLLEKNSTKKEYYLKRKIDDELASKISSLDLPYIYFIDEYHRAYLGGSYFSNIIGFTDIDDNGQAGIEYSKNKELSSTPGIKKVRKDNFGRSVELIELVKKPISGKNIYLSLDKRVQFIGYDVLRNHVRKSNADSASLVVVKNTTGEIIAMVNYPSFNPKNRRELTGQNIRNKVATNSFEPGSSMKPFAIYTALDSKSIDYNFSINTSQEEIRFKKKYLKDYKDLGVLNLEGIIQKSSNIGAAAISRKTKKIDIYNTLKNLDFGNTLYIDWPGIQDGNLYHYNRWSDDDHASISFGYGISVTLLHLANAYVTLANYGKKVQLTYERSDESEVYYDKVLNDKISKDIINMMRSVVEQEGTGKKAKLEKYSVAGKTGTSRILDNGKYSTHKHNAIFVGIVPASKPEYVAAVIVRNPKKGNASGGRHAAPIFNELMSRSLNLLRVYPDIK
ncbi:MAG: penicillin-binding protein 2 [Gammaproteobacteria bacterium]|nr:penicillin-binding protein 2 [Gammaproteobacteria bacterium]MBT4462730.1 penicillin-binding protein 2 [Gammaproteobacteria bacterium]MBT4654394.1 penicillin-binding protein 2 [Gammaproteobacteria bacterium]MBT5116307.1 penicillin-binding protein 2 [Gammaproteobacteria bacterium]MBT5761857.1 penicillin-binding protein 2 [Gammaproteobacteria bacterium]